MTWFADIGAISADVLVVVEQCGSPDVQHVVAEPGSTPPPKHQSPVEVWPPDACKRPTMTLGKLRSVPVSDRSRPFETGSTIATPFV
jgi:hypothetical protein